MTIEYVANRIISGALEYNEFVAARPELKIELDKYLIDYGHEELIK